jgi:chromosome partitioning protein
VVPKTEIHKYCKEHIMADAVNPKTLGPENPKEYFSILAIEGSEALNQIRKQIIEEFGDGSNRRVRTWGIQEAAKMVGRSEPWLRDNDLEVLKNESGHGRWSLERINELRDKLGTRYVRPDGSSVLIVAFSKLKGGVGNTTTCAHFAHFLAREGLKCLVIDFDPQGSMTQLVGGVNPDASIEEEDLPNSALLNKPDDLKYSIRGTYFHNVDLIPANQMLQDLEMGLNQQFMNDEDEEISVPFHKRLHEGLKSCADDYDVVLIDCPPSQGSLTMNALGAANGLVNPLRPVLLDRASMVMYSASASAFYEFNEDIDLKYHRVLINQYKKVKESNAQVKAIRALYGDLVLTNMVMDSQEVKNASGRLETVYSIDRAVGSRESYKRAINSLNAVFGEMLDEFKEIWEMEVEA